MDTPALGLTRHHTGPDPKKAQREPMPPWGDDSFGSMKLIRQIIQSHDARAGTAGGRPDWCPRGSLVTEIGWLKRRVLDGVLKKFDRVRPSCVTLNCSNQVT
jgi:hypothetical protein